MARDGRQDGDDEATDTRLTMYSSKRNINLLTTLLVAHEVRDAVVCPGSRNAPIVHNLNEQPDIRCHPVTDERSAGFYALGIALARRAPVAVCVTSGTALLNLAPAVAEAFYQHVPLVVVSADRPLEWIGQLDGQTLPQGRFLCDFVKKEVTLPAEIHSPSEEWHCNRLLNEALMAMRGAVAGPVHINVPIAEPLFDFSVESQPETRVIRHHYEREGALANTVARWWMEAERPMAVVGQYLSDGAKLDGKTAKAAVEAMEARGVVLSEALCNLPVGFTRVDEALVAAGDDERLLPDFILYFGGTLVSKRLRNFLRRAENARVVMACPDGEVADVTMHLTDVVEVSPDSVLKAFAMQKEEVSDSSEITLDSDYRQRWNQLFEKTDNVVEDYEPPFSQMAAVRYFEQQFEDFYDPFVVHYANSSAVRLANLYAGHHVYCNRGVNGIDGSLSTAAGFSVATDDIVFCVTGDLSFFYDQNALWNQNLRGNLRILLLNNGGGGIFRMLPGLERSAARERLVTASHATDAQGICTQNDIGYLKATDMQQMQMGVVTLMTAPRTRPMVLEVVTGAEEDVAALRQLHQLLKSF